MWTYYPEAEDVEGMVGLCLFSQLYLGVHFVLEISVLKENE